MDFDSLKIVKRLLKLDLPIKQSAFLFGPRKTGKSTYLKENFPNSTTYNLLLSDQYLKLAKEPYKLREEILEMEKATLQYPIIIDEVQKIPLLLDEVHWLIENTDAYFILCGSSARQLRRGSVNLLGGRAWGYSFFPLVYPEIENFNLLKALNHGLIPSHYLSNNPQKSLKAYINDYLKEEIKEESLVRNLPAFAKFLDSLAFSVGELTNYSNIARDCAVDSKTVKEYYQILIDTLLGFYVHPYSPKTGRDSISSTAKFYLFDVGLATFLSKAKIPQLKGTEAGRAFENYILMELMAYKGLNDLDFDIKFWRTKSNLEVDFVLCELGQAKVAIEVKISDSIDKSQIHGLLKFKEENPNIQAYVVSLDSKPRKLLIKDQDSGITILPYKEFLSRLWAGKLTQEFTR